ncbi:uncharacterized protein [Zea mays]|nr:uncharacterized protein LOC103630499 [Zea mays]XP_035816108.1 uncharacterized protein LOC118472265 [Zea mays]AQK86763.1 DNA-binding bromodomain-containing protein [Zea mays]|eukprot:XP_008649782.1 uncharacterized protein LOC103630499 [Zea mays]
MAAVELRDFACKTVKRSASLFLKSHRETRTAGAPVIKKNARSLHFSRTSLHSGDARASKVSSRDAAAKEGDGKRPCSDELANQKTTKTYEPAKKRGVGQPPKSEQRIVGAQENSPIKGRKSSAGAQVDSPSKGRKRSAEAHDDSSSKGGKRSQR